MEEYRVLGSKVISGALYRAETGELTIQMVNGKTYLYYGVEKDVWEGFKLSDSKGKYYTSFIKGKYRE